jgi:hypothetical protein
MMKRFFISTLLLSLAACASQKVSSSADALKEIHKKYETRVGKAAKSELVEEFGQADWCELKPGGTETCRFYKPLGTQWKGDKENRTRYEAYDEVIAEFDPQGVLRDYKARSQR